MASFQGVLQLEEKDDDFDEEHHNDKYDENSGCGCGSVGRAVASDTRDLQFESRHWQNFIYLLYNRKDENKEK